MTKPERGLFTIGFTRKSAEEFFEALQHAGVRRVVDIRLSNSSQLAGFAKGRDLPYLLRAIAGIDYVHRPELAPTKGLLDTFKAGDIDWGEYERAFRELMAERGALERVGPELQDGDCLLCSEPTPEHCHRRLVAEGLVGEWGDVQVCHL